MTDRIRIPRDLKPGDMIIDSEGDSWPFRFYDEGDRNAPICAEAWFTYTGRLVGTRFHAIRIERITSAPAKKAKVDKDARFLIEKAEDLEANAMIASWPGNQERRRYAKRLRAIAKRLNGETK